jgi:rSAM-associated Gly-rich repeat protein
MAMKRRMLATLAALLPLGALGVSAALASAEPESKPLVVEEGAAPPGVASRLQAIRSAVSMVAADQAGLEPGDPNIQKAWWGNWHPGFWGNWHPGWGNGGWHNWHNGWGNGGWHNWHNFWRNW